MKTYVVVVIKKPLHRVVILNVALTESQEG